MIRIGVEQVSKMSTNFYVYIKHECNCKYCSFNQHDDYNRDIHIGLYIGNEFVYCMSPQKVSLLKNDTIVIDEYNKKHTIKEFLSYIEDLKEYYDGKCYS